jgi:deoxycytidylate deaminase
MRWALPNFNKLVQKAQSLIHLNPCSYKHFSFLLKRNKVISWGLNQSYKTHPLAQKYGTRFSSIHSELGAILAFPYKPALLKDCKLVNIRLSGEGELRLSKPCKSCAKLLDFFGISEIFYSIPKEDGELNTKSCGERSFILLN